MKTLPKIPSQLIRLALGDLRQVMEDDKYEVQMTSWHMPFQEKCMVCMAGAVMSKTLEMPSSERFYACELPSHYRDPLYAIDFFRRGEVDRAFDKLSLEEEEGIVFNRNIPAFKIDRSGFFKEMERLAADLEQAGY